MRWIRARFRDRQTRDAAIRVLQELTYAARTQVRDTPEADVAKKVADAFKTVVDSLTEVDDAVINLGPIVIVKRTIAGRSAVRAHRLSVPQIIAIERYPELVENAVDFFQRLAFAAESIEVTEIEPGETAR